MKQARDHDVLVEPRSIQDQCHRGDMLEIGCPAAAARLPVVTLRGPAHGLFQPFGNHSTVSLRRSLCLDPPQMPADVANDLGAVSQETNVAGFRDRGEPGARDPSARIAAVPPGRSRRAHRPRSGGHIDPPEPIRDIK